MRKPSAETELKRLKRDMKLLRLSVDEHKKLLADLINERNMYRGKMNQALADAADWRKRFDLILLKTEKVS